MKLYIIGGKIFRHLKKAQRYASLNGMPKQWVAEERTCDRTSSKTKNSKHFTLVMVGYYIEREHFTITERYALCVPYTDKERRGTNVWYRNPVDNEKQGLIGVYIHKWVDGLISDEAKQQIAEAELRARLDCFCRSVQMYGKTDLNLKLNMCFRAKHKD